MIVDFHTHIFPDELAVRAIPKLEKAGGIKACLNGTLDGLLSSMDEAGIDISVVQNIATKPGQEDSINSWARELQVKSGRIISFGTIHPDSPDWREHIMKITDFGLSGVKLHPDYQGFFVDDERLFPIYEELCERGLIVLFHAGLDIGLPDPCHCTPERLSKVLDKFPEGIWVAAHMGGWRHWDGVEEHLLGRSLYFDTSFSYGFLSPERMKDMIRRHGVERILFGTDSPWESQADAVKDIRSMGFLTREEELIFSGNALRLLKRV